MGNYLPSTQAQRQEMLDAIGLGSIYDVYAAAPSDFLLANGPDIPDGKSELEVSRVLFAMAKKNIVFPSVFRGAGAYRHYIPSIVGTVVNKETFLTAYTPYQAEISQGILQSIFEYQTMICELTGIDASNASVYEGASAAAEAHDGVDSGKGWTHRPGCPGIHDRPGHRLCLPCPAQLLWPSGGHGQSRRNCSRGGTKYILGINPIAAAILKTPADCGADIAVGEGQPLICP